MAQLVVRGLEEDVKARLKKRASRNGRSMEEEARHILRGVLRDESRAPAKLGSRMAARFRLEGLREALPELRGDTARPARFEK